MNKKKILIIVLAILLVGCSLTSYYLYDQHQKKLEQERLAKIEEITSHYANQVITAQQINLYELIDEEYQAVGSVGKNQVLTLNDLVINENSTYFYCPTLNYYVYYLDVIPYDEQVVSYDDRYKNYVPFNQSIVIDGNASLYTNEGNLIYNLPLHQNFPIIIKDDDRYGVEYLNQLVWINKEDVKEVIKETNSNQKINKALRVVAYHQIYNPAKQTCNKIICHSTTQMSSHFKYLNSKGYFTMNMQEMYWYITGKANMPYNSVCITFDDGGPNTKQLVPLLEKYKIHATLFLIGVKYASYMDSDYLELQSHTYNLHSYGVCNNSPRGSKILCISDKAVLADLEKSRALTNAFAFAYPYYEYNSHLISLLKKAGFIMAFEDDKGLVKVNDNPYKISRYTFSNNSSVNELASLLH